MALRSGREAPVEGEQIVRRAEEVTGATERDPSHPKGESPWPLMERIESTGEATRIQQRGGASNVFPFLRDLLEALKATKSRK